jgi:hypothetical protein
VEGLRVDAGTFEDAGMNELSWKVEPDPIPEVSDDFVELAEHEVGEDVDGMIECMTNSPFLGEYVMYLFDNNLNFRREVLDHNRERIDTRAAELQQIAVENAAIDEADSRGDE